MGLELQRRGHDIRMAVPPNLVDFVEAAGLSAVPYGPDSQQQLDVDFFRHFWTLMFRNPAGLIRLGMGYITDGWAEMSTTLTTLAHDADLVLTGTTYQEVALNVAEYHDTPLAALHYFPARVNGHLVPLVPPPLVRAALRTVWWLYWQMTRRAEDAQRRELGLPRATRPSARRFTERGALEIQAYDQGFFAGLAGEWAGSRPFVGALTMQLPTDVDAEVRSWVAAGKPPIYFGFGSMPVESPTDTVTMISAACEELGERALICGKIFEHLESPDDHMKIVGALSHAAVFPACRAVVHHGGAGTTAAGLRAGIPTLILWIGAEQPIWAAQVTRLRVGSARRFTTTSRKTLVKELRKVLDPQCVTRTRQFAATLTTAADSVAKAADLLERTARSGRFT